MRIEDTEFQELVSTMPPDQLASMLAETHWFDYAEAQDIISSIKTTPLADKRIRTVGIYCQQMCFGGAEKVAYLLGCMLQKDGYRIVVITDKEETEFDYVIPDSTRMIVPKANSTNRNNYISRASVWKDIIEDQRIDVIIYNEWASPILMWDVCLFKLLDVSAIVYTHNAFPFSMINLTKFFSTRTYAMSLPDVVITLSEADKVFWSVFNDNVVHLPNPLDPKLLGVSLPDKREGNVIVWVGRFEKVKRPVEAVRIMAHVVKNLPDAVLYMMGALQDPEIVQEVRDEIELLGLRDNIVLTGFQKNPGEYYRKAKLQIITSIWEGYPMMMTEAQAYELPVVMYDIYHLDLNKDEYGVTAVPHGDSAGAAREVVRLLSDEGYYSERCLLVHKAFDQLRSYDLEKVWSDILRGKITHSVPDRETSDMVRLIRDHYLDGFNAYTRILSGKKKAEREGLLLKEMISEYKETEQKLLKEKDCHEDRLKTEKDKEIQFSKELEYLVKEKDKLTKELNDIKGSATYRSAKMVTAPVRKIKRRITKGK